jgi:hypothetical protein
MGTADLDLDAQLDIVVVNQGSGDISLLFGNGDGTFLPEERLAITGQATAVAIADVDRNGAPDLLIARYDVGVEFNSVAVLLGRGDGSFRASQTSAWLRCPETILAADANADGQTDIIVGDYANVVTFLGNGDGTFQFPLSSYTAVPIRFLTTCDCDHDGKLDLGIASGEQNGSSRILFGEGDGRFEREEQPHFAESANTSVIHLGDLDGDGITDIAAGNLFQGQVTVRIVDPTVFVYFNLGTVYAAGNGASSMVVVDFNGDGHLDIAVANEFSDDVSVLFGHGQGLFRDERRFRAGVGPAALVSGDFDADGNLDLAVANSRSDDLTLIFGAGDNTPEAPPPFRFPVASDPVLLRLADLNGDSRLDVLTGSSTGPALSVSLGSGDGSFESARAFDADLGGGAFGRFRSVAVGDLNNDGRADVAVMPRLREEVAVHLSAADGGVGSRRFFPIPFSGNSIALGDLNGDGRLDVVAASSIEDFVVVLLGNGDGTLGGALTLPVDIVILDALALEDINADGRLDVIAMDTFSTLFRGVSVLFGNGDGTFQTQQSVQGVQSDLPVTIADFNRDGYADLVTTIRVPDQPSQVTFHAGSGSGAFLPGQELAVDPPVREVLAGDMNGDGLADLVASVGHPRYEFLVFLGNGDGTFREPQVFYGGYGVRETALGDVDGDGRLDVVRAEASGLRDVAVFLNRSLAPLPDCNQNLVPDECEGVTCAPRRVAGDCDQDGSISITDGICILGHLFFGRPERLPCGSGRRDDPGNIALLDAGGSGRIEISDAVWIFNYLFRGGRPHVRGADCVPIPGCEDACDS